MLILWEIKVIYRQDLESRFKSYVEYYIRLVTVIMAKCLGTSRCAENETERSH